MKNLFKLIIIIMCFYNKNKKKQKRQWNENIDLNDEELKLKRLKTVTTMLRTLSTAHYAKHQSMSFKDTIPILHTCPE